MSNPDPVLHLETKPGRSACGRSLPTAGFFTDNEFMFEQRGNSRCKNCWRVYRIVVERQDEVDFDKPEAKAARESCYAARGQ